MIPLVNSHDEVLQKVQQLIGSDESTTLIIVYYKGHGARKFNALNWKSADPSADSVFWGGVGGIQKLLEQARSPAFILLDFCFATSVNSAYINQKVQLITGAGPTWQMAACSYNHISYAGTSSFTTALVRELQALENLPQGFDIQQLKPRLTDLAYVDHSTIIGEVINNSRPELSRFGKFSMWTYALDSGGTPHAIVVLFDIGTSFNYISGKLVKLLNLKEEFIGGETSKKWSIFKGTGGQATPYIDSFCGATIPAC